MPPIVLGGLAFRLNPGTLFCLLHSASGTKFSRFPPCIGLEVARSNAVKHSIGLDFKGKKKKKKGLNSKMLRHIYLNDLLLKLKETQSDF